MALDIQNPDTVEEEEPVEKEKKKLNAKQLLGFAIALLLIGALATPVWAGWHYSGLEAEIQPEVVALDQALVLLTTQIAQEQAKNTINIAAKEAKIKELTSFPNRIKWAEIIEELEAVTHKTAVASDIDAIFSYATYTATADGTIVVSGFTNSYSAIADLIEALEESEMFKDVKFSSSSKTRENIASLNLSFKLEQEVPVAPAEPAPQVATEPEISA